MIGETIGAYRLTTEIGSGWSGSVFLAEHVRTERPAVVKALRAEHSQKPELLEECFADAKAASLLMQAGITEILDCDVDRDGNAYIVMDYVDAPSLSQAARSLGDLRSIARVGTQIAGVLEAVHKAGIVHGDLKPKNVFLVSQVDSTGSDLTIKLTDFGTAKLQVGQKAWVPSPYVSPEQCRGETNYGPASDIYSLGCILFELACGKAPIEIPPPRSSFDTAWPPDFVELVTAMLDQNPEQRPRSMAEVQERLREAAKERPRVGGTAILENPPGFVPGVEPGGFGEVAATRAFKVPPQATPARSRPPVRPDERPASLAPRRIVVPAREERPDSPPDESRGERWFRRPMVWLATAAVLVLAANGLLLLWPDPKTPEANAAISGMPTTKTAQPPASAPPTEMVALAGGTFTMGSTDIEIQAVLEWCRQKGIHCEKTVLEREKPAHELVVAGFLLDRTEVTNEQLAQWLTARKTVRVENGRFVRDGDGELLLDLHPAQGGIESLGLNTFAARPARAKKPVVQLTWLGADRYCRDQGKRLPAEAEWELAARGILRRPFPWGDREPGCKDAVFGRAAGSGCSPGNGPEDVGTAAEDVTPEGVRDLGGNVAEWTADAYAPYQGSAKDPAIRVIRGGDWAQAADVCRGAGRARSDQAKVQVNVGFRCARNEH